MYRALIDLLGPSYMNEVIQLCRIWIDRRQVQDWVRRVYRDFFVEWFVRRLQFDVVVF